MSKRFVVIGGVIIVLALVLFLVPFNKRVAYFTAPQVIKDALFLVGEEGNASLARIRFGALRTTAYDTLSFNEVVQHNGRVFAILEERGTERMDIYEIRSGEPVALTRDALYKEGLSISPDGTKLAYATVGEPIDGKNPEYYDVRRHEVSLLNLESGVTEAIDQGAHPLFLDNDTLFYTVLDGYQVRHLSAPDASLLMDKSANRIIYRPTASVTNEGTYVAFRNVLNPQEFITLNVATVIPLYLKYQATLVAPEDSILKDISLNGTSAYVVYEQDGETSGIQKVDVLNSTHVEDVFAFPETVSIMSMVIK